VYASWSDGLAQSHSITASAAATYTAVFTPAAGGPNLITNYTYDLWDNLTQVSMPRSAGTQTRTFVYSGKYLTSATNPENGTVNYTYTANGKLASKTDAKGQQIVYTYDAYLRLTQIQRYPTPGNEDACQRTLFYYDTNPFNGSFSQYAYGRPTATKYGISTGGYCASGVPYTFTEQYSYTQAGLVTNKRLAVTAGSRTANLDTSQTYDNEGKVLTVKYPDINSTGPTYTYAYDTMGRPTTLTDNQSATWVSGVQYGLSGELLSLNGETRTYNSRLQLTQVGAMQYTYSPTQNNGQISKQNDLASGEEVTYTYDSLSRLIGAVTTDSPTVTQWGQAFAYDGFGNRTSASVTKGMAPHGNWGYDAATNRLTGYGSDANGNMTTTQSVYGLSYDVENRLVSVPTSSNPEQYAYASDNKRIWRRKPDGTEELYYYGISGQKLVTITPLVAANGDFFMTTLDTNLYFGSRTIVSRGVTVTLDRVGSNRAGGSRYFPYGEEQQTTAQDRDKFATYYRDSTTGLDYAQNRYYANTLGRFMSPDPYTESAGPSDPGSWNRYAYTRGDPVNRADPSGQFDCAADYDPILCDPNPLSPTGLWVTTPYCGPVTYNSTPDNDPGCWFPPSAPIAPAGGGGDGYGYPAFLPADNAQADFGKQPCYTFFGFGSALAARQWAGNATYIPVSDGSLQLRGNTPLDRPAPARSSTPGDGMRIDNPVIYINTDYNWDDFSKTLSNRGVFDFLNYENKKLGTHMTSGQLATMIVLHELLHAVGKDDEGKKALKDLYNACIK